METIETPIEMMTARQRATMLAALRFWKHTGRHEFGLTRAIAAQAGPALSGYEIDVLMALVEGAA